MCWKNLIMFGVFSQVVMSAVQPDRISRESIWIQVVVKGSQSSFLSKSGFSSNQGHADMVNRTVGVIKKN
jgi:hypothetical protein